IMPQEEDAGIVPLEAMASGRPVIAYKKGGATETVVEGITGLFFDQQTPAALIEAVQQCSKVEWKPDAICQHAEKFDRLKFQDKIKQFVQQAYQTYSSQRG
ncbi:MAG: glycosyltransferase, partial [Patescibacteria group bacterium]